MFGTLVPNRQLKELRDNNKISINPFEEQFLKGTHYTLHPGQVLRRQSNGTWRVVHSFLHDKSPFILEANEYVVVQPREQIIIHTKGLVGRFVTSSSNIESALLVISGQIDSKYGERGEAVRFGLKNLLSERN